MKYKGISRRIHNTRRTSGSWCGPSGLPGAVLLPRSAPPLQLFNGGKNSIKVHRERIAGGDFAGGVKSNAVSMELFAFANPRFKTVHNAENPRACLPALNNCSTHFDFILRGAAGAALESISRRTRPAGTRWRSASRGGECRTDGPVRAGPGDHPSE